MQRLKDYIKHQLTIQATKFGDLRFTAQVVFAAIVILIFWSGARSIETNYKLQQNITATKQHMNAIKLENNSIQLQNDYYQSKQYLELSARQNLGLAYPGETELLVPRSVALSYIAPIKNGVVNKNNTSRQASSFQKDLADWFNFFLDKKS